MKKTLQALDELMSSIVTLIPTWLNMLKSTRVLTLLGTGAVIYLTWTQGGLTEAQSQVAAMIEGVLGVTFIGFKTLRSSTPAPIVDSNTVEPEVAVKPKPKEVVYESPMNIDEFCNSLIGTNYEKFQDMNDILTDYKLDNLHPSVRLNIAQELVNVTIDALDDAWADELVKTKCAKTALIPDFTVFSNSQKRSAFEKMVMDETPGCEWLSTHQKLLLQDYERLYKWSANIAMLTGKPIKWDMGYNSCEMLGKFGLQAVG